MVSADTLPREGVLRQVSAGIAGALLAGALVGLHYGFVGAAEAGGGAVSLLLVIVLVSALCAGAAGAAIAAGMAVSRTIWPKGWHWQVAGGALGGITKPPG